MGKPCDCPKDLWEMVSYLNCGDIVEVILTSIFLLSHYCREVPGQSAAELWPESHPELPGGQERHTPLSRGCGSGGGWSQSGCASHCSGKCLSWGEHADVCLQVGGTYRYIGLYTVEKQHNKSKLFVI